MEGSRPLAVPLMRRGRNLRLPFGMQTFSLLGSGATTVGLAIFTYQLTGGPAAAVIIGNALMLRLVARFPLFTSVWQVCGLIFAINAVTACFTPTFEASITEIVGAEQFIKAYSLSRVAVDVEDAASPALVGILTAFLGIMTDAGSNRAR